MSSSTSQDQATRNRSNSVEDQDLPEHERKRPRLSEGRSDAEEILPPLETPTNRGFVPASPIARSSDHGEGNMTSPPLPARGPEAGMGASPTSKVTINTRPLSSQSMATTNAPVNDADTADVSTSANTTENNSQNTELEQDLQSYTSNVPDLPSQEPISISSSPDKSPEIEIAEVEDYDQDPTETRWTTRIGGTSSSRSRSIEPAHVYRTFPFACERKPGDARPVVLRLSRIFQEGDPNDGDIFQQVKNWLVDFTARCNIITKSLIEEDVGFWQVLPNLVEYLLRRETIAPRQAREHDLSDFFTAYGRISRMVMEYDAKLLERATESEDPQIFKSFILLSWAYVPSLSWTVSTNVPFYEALRTLHDFDAMKIITAVLDRLADPTQGNIFPAITNLIKAYGGAMSKKVTFYRNVISLLTLLTNLMQPFGSELNESSSVPTTAFAQISNIRDGSARVLLKADDVLQEGITKQVSWLTIETGSDLVNMLNPLIRNIAVEIPRVGKDIILSIGITFDDTDLTDLPIIMLYAWKFKVLRRFIMVGRMELRVYGIETMSSDLVAIYRHHILDRPDGNEDPLVRFLVRFIQETRLIDYIVGVDSHPQLIQRSANVIGFLCVAKMYSDSHTDTIWQTVLESQDSRTVVEVLHVLQCNFHTYELPALHYLAQKLLELPLERFDSRMLQFSVTLLELIQSKSNASPTLRGQPYDSVTRKLCIRLLREASTPQNLMSDQTAQIRREMSFQMPKTLRSYRADRSKLTIDQEEETAILQQIRQDIENHTEFACGATLVMQSILSLLDQDGLVDLLSKYDYISILMEDLSHLCEYRSAERSVSMSALEVEYESRMSCLFLLLIAVPNGFHFDRLESLWNSSITAKNLPDLIRSKTWTTLTDVMKESSQRNPAVDKVLKGFFPRLKSRDFDKSVLKFAEEAVKYDCQQCTIPLIDAEGVISIPGIERVWKIMLEAPTDTVEADATDFIIRQYLAGNALTTRSRSCVEATHSALIDRCVQLVMASASRLRSFESNPVAEGDNQMTMTATDEEIKAEELRFSRSLLFLRRFLESHNSSRYSPNAARQQRSLPIFKGRKGENMELRIQLPFSKYVTTDPQKVLVGTENMGSELWQYLAEGSGFTRFNVIALGHKIDLQDESATIAELKLNTGLIIVQKVAETPENIPAAMARTSSPVDNKVMHHFEELYGLLDADEHLAEQVYNFLSVSSAQNGMVRVVRSMSQTPLELLPPGKPYKLLYCTQSLRTCIEDESYSSNPDTDLLRYSIHTILSVLPKLNLSMPENNLQVSIAYDLTDALNLALKARVSSEVSKAYVLDHEGFVGQMLSVLQLEVQSGKRSGKTFQPKDLSKTPFEALVEASLHDERIWAHLDPNEKFKALLERILLQDTRSEVRRSSLGIILGLTGASGTKLSLRLSDPRAPRSRFPQVAIETCLTHLWNILSTILPAILKYSTQCQEILDASLVILRRIGKSLSIEALRIHFEQWSLLLLEHEHQEIVGQPLRDFALAGLTKLLLECCRFLKVADAIPSSGQLVQEVLTRFLFPALSDSGKALEIERIPVLDSHVRETLYDLVLVLCQDSNELDAVVSDLSDDLVPDDFFEPQFGHDRQALRTEVGYSGLRNLSNTCYLNSLFSQLFMNVHFREFLLTTNIVDESKQKLIVELAKVFAYMQNSFDKSIDPTSAIESITTYEGDQIDVTIQMDVDEFFNLLFDRLEGQIFDSKARNVFKSMYGGQIVQQIKSKECEHISERLEPFTAIPVEIKGKTRLEDSLAAYVEGEVLQGENKYSCTACGRHVDAVKRACLKDVPDNLIFNLKRFDFDIMTGMRCKVNDEFHFPETIDVAPYSLESLMHPDKAVTSDLFELTGIIVHSGTADSGHYYSFIRQRPSVKEKQESWVQFNDHDVTMFDPAHIQDTCFGGVDSNNIFNLLKFYNGYMLFYQRTSSIEKLKRIYAESNKTNPVRLALPLEMERHITQQNELFLRAYCAQDPSHARFVRQLLERIRIVDQKGCSDTHTLETRMLNMVLQHVQQIPSRWKGLPDFDETILMLNDQSTHCYRCAEVIVDWNLEKNIIGGTIVRSPYLAVRKGFGSLLSVGLRALHDTFVSREDELPDSLRFLEEYHACVQSSVKSFANEWDVITRSGRPWAEYFGTLQFILQLGDDEAVFIIDENFIERCVEVVSIHQFNSSDFPIKKHLRTRYSAYLNAREKNRPFNHLVLNRFLISMLLKVDLHMPPNGLFRSQEDNGPKIGLSPVERDLLGLSQMPYKMEWLRRLIAGRQSPHEADAVVAHLAADRLLAGSVSSAITKGLDNKSMAIAASFLQPALVFIEYCRTENLMLDLVASALEGISTIGLDYGKEYLEFVQGLLKGENKALGADPGFLVETVLHYLHQWAPVFLLCPNEIRHDVRGDTVSLLSIILFQPLQEAEVENQVLYRSYRTCVQELAFGAQRYVQDTFFAAHAKENASLQPGQANQLIEVVDRCLEFFELDNPVQEARVIEIQNAMAMLRMKAEQAAETVSTAEWQESSELEAMGDSDFDGIVSPE